MDRQKREQRAEYLFMFDCVSLSYTQLATRRVVVDSEIGAERDAA